jgi:hypothetical protein
MTWEDYKAKGIPGRLEAAFKNSKMITCVDKTVRIKSQE